MESELLRLRSEIWKLKSVAGRTPPPHCLSGLVTLKYHPQEHFLDDLQRFRSVSSRKVGTFEQFNVLIKKSRRMKPRRLSMGMHGRVENTSNALNGVQRTGS